MTNSKAKNTPASAKQIVALTIFVFVVYAAIQEMRVHMPYQTWLNWMLVLIICSLTVGMVGTWLRRRRSRSPK